jgi:hypothetical protein
MTVALGFRDLIDHQEALFQLRRESENLAHRQAVGHFCFLPGWHDTSWLDSAESAFTTTL